MSRLWSECADNKLIFNLERKADNIGLFIYFGLEEMVENLAWFSKESKFLWWKWADNHSP